METEHFFVCTHKKCKLPPHRYPLSDFISFSLFFLFFCSHVAELTNNIGVSAVPSPLYTLPFAACFSFTC